MDTISEKLKDKINNGHYYPYAKAIKSIAIGEDVIWSVPAAMRSLEPESDPNQLTINEMEVAQDEPAEQEIQDSGESRIYEESGTDSSEDIDQIRMEVNDNEFTE